MAGEKQIAPVNDANKSDPLSPMQLGMLGHFQSVLKGMAADLSQRVVDLPLLADAEQRQLLAEWNDTETDFPQDKCVHELFETQVSARPILLLWFITRRKSAIGNSTTKPFGWRAICVLFPLGRTCRSASACNARRTCSSICPAF